MHPHAADPCQFTRTTRNNFSSSEYTELSDPSREPRHSFFFRRARKVPYNIIQWESLLNKVSRDQGRAVAGFRCDPGPMRVRAAICWEISSLAKNQFAQIVALSVPRVMPHQIPAALASSAPCLELCGVGLKSYMPKWCMTGYYWAKHHTHDCNLFPTFFGPKIPKCVENQTSCTPIFHMYIAYIVLLLRDTSTADVRGRVHQL